MEDKVKLPRSFHLQPELEDIFCRVLKIDSAEWQAVKSLYAAGTAWTVHRIPKKRGERIIHAPSDPLKKVLRAVLKQFLQCVPVHVAVHGAHPGTSIITNARVHVGSKSFYQLDLKDAFPSVNRKRCETYFKNIFIGQIMVSSGLQEKESSKIAQAIVDLLLVDDILPQGFPTSPAVLNLLLGDVDRCIAEVLREISKLDGFVYRYTRFVDDLTISCDSDAIPKKLRKVIRRVVEVEKWVIQGTKLAYFGEAADGDEERSTRYPEVTGLIPNPDGRLTIPRPRLNKFRAILHSLMEPDDRQLSTKEHRLLVGIIGFISMVYDGELPSIIKKPYLEAKGRFKIGEKDVSTGRLYSLINDTKE